MEPDDGRQPAVKADAVFSRKELLHSSVDRLKQISEVGFLVALLVFVVLSFLFFYYGIPEIVMFFQYYS